MTVGELIERLQSLGASYNANIIVWDRKEREFEIIGVDSVLKGEVAIDIQRTKEDYSGR